MADLNENNTKNSDRHPITPSQFVITEIVDGKAVKMKYNRFIYKYEKLPDKPIRTFHPNGNMAFEKLPDGTSRGWFENKQLKFEQLPDGSERDWFENGQMRSEYIPGVIERGWYPSGKLAYKHLPNGNGYRWDANGQLKCEIFNSTVTEYNSSGKIIRHATNGKSDTATYLKVKERREALRKMVAKKIDDRESKRLDSEKKSYKRVIKNKTLTKLLVSLKAMCAKQN